MYDVIFFHSHKRAKCHTWRSHSYLALSQQITKTKTVLWAEIHQEKWRAQSLIHRIPVIPGNKFTMTSNKTTNNKKNKQIQNLSWYLCQTLRCLKKSVVFETFRFWPNKKKQWTICSLRQRTLQKCLYMEPSRHEALPFCYQREKLPIASPGCATSNAKGRWKFGTKTRCRPRDDEFFV